MGQLPALVNEPDDGSMTGFGPGIRWEKPR